MERIITLDRLIIFPNTTYTKQSPHKYIISGRGFELDAKVNAHISYWMAGTDTDQVYEHFWNTLLRNDDKVPAITHMLYRLGQENDATFRYIMADKENADKK